MRHYHSVLASPLRVIILSTVLTSVIAIAVAWQFRELPADKDMTATATPNNSNSNAGDSSAARGENAAGGVAGPAVRAGASAAGASSLKLALLAGDASGAARHIERAASNNIIAPASVLLRERRFWQFLAMALFTVNLKQIFRHLVGSQDKTASV